MIRRARVPRRCIKRKSLCACAALGILMLLASGCGGYKSTRPSGAASAQTGDAQYRKELLDNVIAMFQSPERFDDEQKAADQVVERLNQWAKIGRDLAAAEGTANADGNVTSPTSAAAKETAPVTAEETLVDTLPEPLQKMHLLRTLNSEVYDAAYDPAFLREAVIFARCSQPGAAGKT